MVALPRSRLLCCALLASVARAQLGAFSINGTDSCPCIDPFEFYGLNATNCTLQRSSNGVCFPNSYGTQGCQAYDSLVVTRECRETLFNTPPTWCAASWCWVDPDNCNRPNDLTSFFSGSAEWADKLVYSYETCGNINEFTDSGRTDQLNGLHLRVSFPGASGSGYTIVNTAPGAGVHGTAKDGSTVRFFAALAAEYNMTWSEVSVSDESRTFSPSSSFTACVHELALNSTDVCVGNFWPTPTRRRIASFTADLYTDDFHLIALKDNSTSTGGGVVQFFSLMIDPFDGYTWSCLTLTVLYFGIVMWLVEAGQNQEDFPERSPLTGLFLGMYKATFATTTLDFRFTPTTFPGRLVLCVFSMTSMLMVTFYASQITSNMVESRSIAAAVKSLEEAIGRQYTFCLLSAIEDPVKTRYPQLNNERTISVSNAGEVFAGMDNGLCKAGFVTADEWRKNQNGECHNKVKLESIVFSMGNAYPVRTDLQAPVSWAIAKALVGGAYDPYRQAAQRDFLPVADTSECDQADTARASGLQSLSLTKTAGPMVMSILTCTFAVILFVWDDTRKSARKRRPRNELTKQEEMEAILMEPSFAERTCAMGRRDQALAKEAERESPAYNNQDLKLISKMYRSRDMTQVRINAASSLRTDGALSLNDVPMLLKVMRETFGLSLSQQGGGASGGDDPPYLRKGGFSQYLRDSTVLDEGDVDAVLASSTRTPASASPPPAPASPPSATAAGPSAAWFGA
jgi:hypothetical protein